MIKYENANNVLDNIIDTLNDKGKLDDLIMITLIELPDNEKNYVANEIARKLFKGLEKKTDIIYNRSFAAQIIERYIKRGTDYLYSLEHWSDIHILEEACRYKIKFVKLSQKTSQIKNRRKTR